MSTSTPPQTFRPDLVPTWAKVAAWLVPATTLPSITWRMNTIVGGLVSDENPCVPPHTAPWEKVYLLAGLPSLQLGLAMLTIGLIRPWGESFPRWLPIIGSRVVPVALAVRAATTGAVLLLIIASFMAFPHLSDALWNAMGLDRPPGASPLPDGCEVPGWEVARWYLPMALWPPLLLALTWHYRRRRRSPSGKVSPSPESGT